MCCCIATTCHAMNEKDQEKKPIILATIPCKNVQQLGFLNNNEIIINNTQECATFNAITGAIIEIINSQDVPHIDNNIPILSIHPNKSIFTLSNNYKTFAYSTYAANKIPFMKWHYYHSDTNSVCNSVSISPHDSSLIRIDHSAQETWAIHHQYTTKKLVKFDLNPAPTYFSFCPVKKNTSCSSCIDGTVIQSITNKNVLSSSIQIEFLKTTPLFCEYSFNGLRLIIVNTSSNICIVEPQQFCNVLPSTQPLKNIIVCPHSPTIVTLYANNDIITFWDIETLECICTLPPLSNNVSTNEYDASLKLMDVSPDDSELLVALENHCVIIPIPLIAMLNHIDREKVLTAYLSLQHYNPKLDCCDKLPHDITQLLTYYLAVALKYKPTTNHHQEQI
jgi:hypothetical protein